MSFGTPLANVCLRLKDFKRFNKNKFFIICRLKNKEMPERSKCKKCSNKRDSRFEFSRFFNQIQLQPNPASIAALATTPVCASGIGLDRVILVQASFSGGASGVNVPFTPASGLLSGFSGFPSATAFPAFPGFSGFPGFPGFPFEPKKKRCCEKKKKDKHRFSQLLLNLSSILSNATAGGSAMFTFFGPNVIPIGTAQLTFTA